MTTGCSSALASALLLVTSGCAVSPTASDIASPFRFKLAAKGLPTEGLWKSNPVLRDINRDGRMDLASHLRLGDGPKIWLGDGRGNWSDNSRGLSLSQTDNISCGGGIDFGDINRDGRDDLAVADHCSGTYVFLADGHGQWKLNTAGLKSAIAEKNRYEEVNPYVGAEFLTLGDVNEDGALDLVVSASDRGGFSVFLGDGSGSNWKEQLGDGLPSADDPVEKDPQMGGWATRFLLRDLDGDGHLDVAASYYTGPRVWRGDGKGHWKLASQGLPSIGSKGALWGVAAGDVNKDGRQDLLFANTDEGPQLFLQRQDGSWQTTPEILPKLKGEGGAQVVALGDLDRDGHLDMAVGILRGEDMNSAYGLVVLRGDGKGAWAEWEDTGLPESGLEIIWGMALGDVNGDDRLDLAVTSGSSSPLPKSDAKPKLLPRVQVWLNESKK